MNGVESAAQMSVGQAILKMVDKVMWIIEKSVQWSLPAPEAVTGKSNVSYLIEKVFAIPTFYHGIFYNFLQMVEKKFTEENGKSFGKPELVRPLPWIIFLPTILMLRLFRASINTVAVVFGYPAVEPSDMVITQIDCAYTIFSCLLINRQFYRFA